MRNARPVDSTSHRIHKCPPEAKEITSGNLEELARNHAHDNLENLENNIENDGFALILIQKFHDSVDIPELADPIHVKKINISRDSYYYNSKQDEFNYGNYNVPFVRLFGIFYVVKIFPHR